jgi:hypothetical protein
MSSALDLPVVRQTRRNHAFEHATIHVLSSRVRGLRMSGISDAGGFTLFGDVPTAQVKRAAEDALARLQQGEVRLAIHPNCGTNLVTTGAVTSATAMLTTQGIRKPGDMRDRFPLVMFSMIAAVVVSQPLGYWMQRNVTTDGDPADMEITGVTRGNLGKVVVHRVSTRSS